MALSEETITWLETELAEETERRGTEYGRFYGLHTATIEWMQIILESPGSHDDEDVYDTELGVEAATVAEDWVEDFYWDVLDEVYECDTKDKFYAKFTTTCSLAWLYFWDVLHWEEGYEAFTHLIALNEERNDWDGPKPLPQWLLDEVAERD